MIVVGFGRGCLGMLVPVSGFIFSLSASAFAFVFVFLASVSVLVFAFLFRFRPGVCRCVFSVSFFVLAFVSASCLCKWGFVLDSGPLSVCISVLVVYHSVFGFASA